MVVRRHQRQERRPCSRHSLIGSASASRWAVMLVRIGFRLTKPARGCYGISLSLWYDEQKHPQRIGSGVILTMSSWQMRARGSFNVSKPAPARSCGRLEAPGPDHWGSIVSADGRLYVTNQKGTTVVFAPNTEKFETPRYENIWQSEHSTAAFLTARSSFGRTAICGARRERFQIPRRPAFR